jgi:hypothetical protein
VTLDPIKTAVPDLPSGGAGSSVVSLIFGIPVFSKLELRPGFSMILMNSP